MISPIKILPYSDHIKQQALKICKGRRDLSQLSKGKSGWQNNSLSSCTSISLSTTKILPSYDFSLPYSSWAGDDGSVIIQIIVWVSHKDPCIEAFGPYRLTE